MMRAEFDKAMASLGGHPEDYSNEDFEKIHQAYIVCDVFQYHSDICKFVFTFGMEGVERFNRQYSARQKEIDKLRSQNSTLIAKLCKIFNEAILNDDKSLKKMAINFFKEENLDD